MLNNKSYFKKLGWVVKDFNPSQITYELIEQSNKYLETHSDISINSFFIENSKPVIDPKFPRFNLKDCTIFDGILIATDSVTCQSIKNSKRNELFYYISDLHDLLRSRDIVDILQNDDILKFTRSPSYQEIILYNFPKARFGKVVEDFDIDQILEVVKG